MRPGLSFDLQLIPELMADMAEILKEAPDTRVALCHAGSPHDRSQKGIGAYAHALKHLSELPHVYCKLSGLGMFEHLWSTETIRPIINTCIDQFGPDRCMFGSNSPVDKLYSDYDKLMRSYLEIIPTDFRRSVFSDVASEFYNFESKVPL